MPTLTVPRTYTELRRAVQLTLIHGQRSIEQAKVRTYWETGRLIREHVLAKKSRASYGTKTIARLSAELSIESTVLHRCVRFAECFPIVAARPQLTWAHYRALFAIEDPAQRLAIAAEATKHEWTSREVEVRVADFNRALSSPDDSEKPSTGAPVKLLTAKRGKAGTYRVVARGEALAVDLGFKLYLALDADAPFKAGGFATFDSRGRPLPAPDATKADLFTYAVTVRRVIDGDTLEVEIPLPRGYAHALKLRLRALDCPEMDTPAGKAAKRFTESLLLPATTVEIVTTKPDKYDRYLADVFVPNGAGDDVFLNNELLKSGHATRLDE